MKKIIIICIILFSLIFILIFFDISIYRNISEIDINNGKIKISLYLFEINVYEKQEDTFFSKEFLKFFIKNEPNNWKPLSMNDFKLNIFNSRHYDFKLGVLPIYCNDLRLLYRLIQEQDEKRKLLLEFYELMRSENITGIQLFFKEKTDLLL